MSLPEPDLPPTRRVLSALADGEATDAEGADAFHAWREDADARETWLAYHLIGDVMRSDDLAAPPASQQRLLLALRARLASEPIVLAPQAAAGEEAHGGNPRPVPAVANGRAAAWVRAHWQAPVAMAAGFLAVIGGLQFARAPSSTPAGRIDASLAQAAPQVAVTVASGALIAGQTTVSQAANPAAALSRSEAEQIAPYLAAHRMSTMNAAFQMPSGDIRTVSLVQPAQ